ncbi:hypothetical protein [Pseudonocardia sp.]|uniref:hypothetical protein n=1 Tax=Pseudonocardia sp. TaxID=60912 RepID=UPI003D09D141
MTRRVLAACAAVAILGTVAGCRGTAGASAGSGPGAQQQVQEFESVLRDVERELDADRG